ncbi:MAG: hypothetical protein HYZ68_00335 [Chloroflexi bacterium]|nr:hypothetical protein [Chloroflexota bacterium]
MSLIAFHKFLISTAILFSLGFSIWAFLDYSKSGDPSTVLLAIGSGISAVLLGIYLRHLRRFLGI